MSSQPPKPKRIKISPAETSAVSWRLSNLDKDDLLEVAQAGITESREALNLAKTLLDAKEIRMLHCVRCHEDYDPKNDRNKDCVMQDHEENEGMIRCHGEGGGGWDAFKYPCCEKMEDDSDPCFEGSHMSEYADGGYWQDDQLEEINKDCDCSTCNPQESSSDDDDDDDDDDDN